MHTFSIAIISCTHLVYTFSIATNFQYSFNHILLGRHNLTLVYIIHDVNLQTPRVMLYSSTLRNTNGADLATVLPQTVNAYLLVKIMTIANTIVSTIIVHPWNVNVSYSRNARGVHGLKWKKKHKTLVGKQKQS